MEQVVKKRVFVFSNGQKTWGSGGMMISPNSAELVDEINLDEATDEEFKQIRLDLNNDKLIQTVKKRIDKDLAKK